MDKLYQHSIEDIILTPVPGSWISCQLIQPPPKADIENSFQTYENIRPTPISNQSFKKTIFPAMPAVSPFINESILEESKKHIEISAPLKGNNSPYTQIYSPGYRSGRRSSIIPCRKVKDDETLTPSDWVIGTDSITKTKYVVDFTNGTVLVRCKGCGMWLKSYQITFPSITIEKSESIYAEKDQIVFEIFGISFENTSLSEMYYTSKLEENFKKIGLLTANHPLGFWIYRDLQNDNSPLITKNVSIFETLGDIRLESHLITGLERLLRQKYDQLFAKNVIDLISPLYEKVKNKNKCTYQKISLITNDCLHQKIKDGSLFNFDDFELSEFTENSLRLNGIVPSHEIYEKLQTLDNDFANLVKLFGHLGFECGKCLSVVHRSGFIWGVFTDHRPGNFQCNAHCDNLVVLPKDKCLSNDRMIQVLAPLDFDMCYCKESTIDFTKKPPVPDESVFIENLLFEFNFMVSDIGGYFATFKNFINSIKPRPKLPGCLDDVLWMIRDCAVFEFYQGYQKVNCERCKGNDITVDDMYSLINQGLAKSINENS